MKHRFLPLLASFLVLIILTACGSSSVVGNSSDRQADPSNRLSPSSDATAPTTQVEISDNDAVNYTDIFAYIRARVPDAMRGPSSVNANPEGPMYIVDGIQTSDISYLRPIDVYSIESVRGSATAIYGFRAAGGVIVITTKAGHIQKEAEERERREAKAARKAAREAARAAKKDKGN